MDYKKMKFEDIYAWCEEHGELDWLEATVAQDMTVEVYPFETYTGKDGKEHRRYDKSKTPIIEERPISFLLVKEAFISKFVSDIKPKTPKKPSMRDIMAARKKG